MNTVNTQIKIDLEDWNEVEELLRAMESLRLQESKMYYVLIFPVNSRLFILILWDWRSLWDKSFSPICFSYQLENLMIRYWTIFSL